MAKAYKNSTETLNSLNQQISANNSLSSVKQQQIQQEGDRRSSGLQNAQIDLNYNSTMSQLALKGVELVINTASKIYDGIVSDQTQQANLRNSARANEGTRLFNEGLQNGSIYWGSDESGNAKLIISPELQEWHDGMVSQIEGSKQIGSVRQNELESFEQTWDSLLTKGHATAIEKSYSDYNQAFSLNLNSATTSDVASFVASGGNLETWASNNVIHGVAEIYNRRDWSSERKAAEARSYVNNVAVQGVSEIASRIALSEGNTAANDYLYAKNEDGSYVLGFLTENQRQSAYAIAAKGNSNRASAVASSMVDYMEQSLLSNADPNSEPAPISDAYKEIYKAIENESPETKRTVIQSVKAKQTEIVTTAAAQSLMSDSEAGIDKLERTYEAIKNGELDDVYFMGIPEVKTNIMQSYQKAISNYQKTVADATGTTIEDVRKANKSVISQFETQYDTYFTLFDSGQIDGNTLVQNIGQAAAIARLSIQGNDAASIDQITSMYGSMMDKLVNAYVPKKYQQMFNNKMEMFKLNYQALNSEYSSDKKLTAALADEIAFSTGYFADWLYENGATMTEAEASKFLEGYFKDLALSFTDDTWSQILSGAAIPRDNASKAIKSFNAYNNKILSSGASKSFVYDKNAEHDIKNPSGSAFGPSIEYEFLDDRTRDTIDSMADLLATQVTYIQQGTDNPGVYTQIRRTATLGRDENGNIVLSPIVTAPNGTSFRVRNEYIEYCKPGETRWQPLGVKMQTTPEKMTKALEKASSKRV